MVMVMAILSCIASHRLVFAIGLYLIGIFFGIFFGLYLIGILFFAIFFGLLFFGILFIGILFFVMRHIV